MEYQHGMKVPGGLHEWHGRLSDLVLDKVFMNRLVLDYLVIEGYKDAAEAFSRESGVQPEIDLETIADRMSIRAAIQHGDVQKAIHLVDELDARILRDNKELTFHLQQQQLIEIIRQGRVDEALLFAQQRLAPAGEANPHFLAEIERTMALLAFEDSTACPVGHLLEPAQRQKTASELNSAILASQTQQTEPKLPTVLRMLLWSQGRLAEAGVQFPKVQLDQLADGQLEMAPIAERPPHSGVEDAQDQTHHRHGQAYGLVFGGQF